MCHAVDLTNPVRITCCLSSREVTQLGVEFVDAEGGISVAMCVAGLEEYARTHPAT